MIRRPSLSPLTVVAVGLEWQETTQAEMAVQVVAVAPPITLALRPVLAVLLQGVALEMTVATLFWPRTLVMNTPPQEVVVQEPLGAIPTVPLVGVLILALMVVLVRAA